MEILCTSKGRFANFMIYKTFMFKDPLNQAYLLVVSLMPGSNVENYHPISKIIKSAVHDQVYSYLSVNMVNNLLKHKFACLGYKFYIVT